MQLLVPYFYKTNSKVCNTLVVVLTFNKHVTPQKKRNCTKYFKLFSTVLAISDLDFPQAIITDTNSTYPVAFN